MAIRIRKKGNGYIALCAAKSKPKEKDIYLNDGMHTALSDKFYDDFKQMGFIKEPEKSKHLQWIDEHNRNL